MGAAYQCVKFTDGKEYCSKKKVKSHAEGRTWIAKVMRDKEYQQSNMRGTRQVDSQPSNAFIW